MGDLDGDGRAALLDTIADASDHERRRAAIHLADQCLHRSDLKRLLWALDLHNRPAPTRKGHPE
jgi:hypothetical protein